MAIVDVTLSIHVVDEAKDIEVTELGFAWLHARNAALSLCLDNDLVHEDMDLKVKVREEE